MDPYLSIVLTDSAAVYLVITYPAMHCVPRNEATQHGGHWCDFTNGFYQCYVFFYVKTISSQRTFKVVGCVLGNRLCPPNPHLLIL